MDTLILRSWSANDLPLLRSANTEAMTAHLNGPETEDQIIDRHEKYLRLTASGEAWVFVIEEDGAPLGSIGYWPAQWRGVAALEAGWFVLPAAQGRGIASAALGLAIERARMDRGDRRFLTAFPAVSNPGSNGVCRRTGFTAVGSIVGEFRGSELVMNEWVLDLEEGDASFPLDLSAVSAQDVQPVRRNPTLGAGD